MIFSQLQECECKACSKVKPKKRASNTSPRRSPSKSSRLERTATASSQEEDEEAAVDDPLGMEEEDADEAEKTFHCALCPHKFVHPEDLEEHVKISHDNEPDVKPPLKNIQVVVKNQAQAQQVRSEMWQTSMERNWAADFGYGKAKAGMPIGDLFSKMKMKFQTSTSTDEEECNSNVSKQKPAETSEDGKKDEDEFEAYRVRGFKGTEKCCLQKAPRTLSASSLVTRKRIAELVVRAREHQIERERKRNLSKNNRSTRSTRAAKKAAASGAVFTEIATTSERTGAIKPHPKKKQQSSSQATATVGTTDQTKTIPEVDRRQVGRTVAPKDSNPSKEVEMGNKSTGDQVQNEQSKIPQLPPPSSGLVENPPAKQKEQNPPEKEKDATPDIGEDSDGYESSDSDSEDELIASLEPQPITEADRAEAEDIVLEVMSREAESIMIPLNNGWVCEKVPVRKSSAAAAAERISKYKNYFWSTEDTAIDPFKSILAIQAYCKKMGMKMNRAIFEKALLFDPDAADRGRENEEVLPSTLIDLEDSEVQVGRVLSPPSVAQPSNLPLADSAGKKVNQRNRPMVQIHNQVTTTLQSNVVVQDEIVTLKIEVEDEATD